MRAAIPVSISVGLVLALGCGKPVPLGRYRGERNVEVRPGTDPIVAGQLRRLEMDVQPGGRATYRESGIPFEGQVTREGDRLRFVVLTVADINVEKQGPDVPRSLTFDILQDGSLRRGDAVLRPASP